LVVDSSGHVLAKHGTNGKQPDSLAVDFSEFNYDAIQHYSDTHYDASSDAVLLLRTSKRYFEGDARFFEHPFLAWYGLSDGRMRLLPLYYPDFYKEEGKVYSYKWFPLATVSGDEIIYGFQAASDIYSYNMATGQKRDCKCPSQYTKNRAVPIRTADHDLKGFDFANGEITFYRPQVSADGRYIYRIHDTGRQEGRPYKAYLSVFDRQLTKLAEVEIPDADRLYPVVAFMAQDALMVPIKSEFASEGGLTFLRFRADEEAAELGQ
jgi:hypothetical protein